MRLFVLKAFVPEPLPYWCSVTYSTKKICTRHLTTCPLHAYL